jgi:hypothetical protein
MSNWNNRPVYDKITRDIIATVSNDPLAWAVFDHIWFKAGKDFARTNQVLAELPAGFGVVYHLFALDGEIGNGGFNQYFFNGLDRDAEHQFEALRKIGAIQHQHVFLDAFSIRDRERQNKELQRRYAERTIESFFSTYGMTKLEKCDKEWYALDKEFDTLLIRLIRQYPELFVTKE